MRRTFIAVAVLVGAIPLAGCAATSGSGVSSISLNAIALGIDDFRSSAETFLTAEKLCYEMMAIDLDLAAAQLCNRSAMRPLGEQGKVVAGLIDDAYQQAEVDSPCEMQLTKIGDRLLATTKVTFATGSALGRADETTDVSGKLDAFDRSFERLEASFTRAQELCSAT